MVRSRKGMEWRRIQKKHSHSIPSVPFHPFHSIYSIPAVPSVFTFFLAAQKFKNERFILTLVCPPSNF
ncbi:hypothetical protein BpHYR1_018062 [Brachionus plicatilis]|uniref:Uncharacterized protein n=1 Tax=Brachionus plicatilis TaxID=10195 RepID=A0A3M7S450_BRAPC|nr:hypothetical protein BpHYR1_018062 [Brachionus plicatilis]